MSDSQLTAKALFPLIGILLVASAYVQYAWDASYDSLPVRAGLPLSLLIPTEALSRAAFGFDAVLADALWIDMIQGLSKWRGDEALPRYLDRIVALDPKFEHPYRLGITFLPWFGRMAEAERLAERGMAALPHDWEIPFYLGAQYHIQGGSFDKALHYVTLAAQKPGAPELVRRMQAVYAARTGYIETAKAFFATIYETTDDESAKELALEWLERLDALKSLEQAVSAYHDRFGSYPSDVGELVLRGVIQEIPEEIGAFPIAIDAATGKLYFRRK